MAPPFSDTHSLEGRGSQGKPENDRSACCDSVGNGQSSFSSSSGSSLSGAPSASGGPPFDPNSSSSGTATFFLRGSFFTFGFGSPFATVANASSRPASVGACSTGGASRSTGKTHHPGFPRYEVFEMRTPESWMKRSSDVLSQPLPRWNPMLFSPRESEIQAGGIIDGIDNPGGTCFQMAGGDDGRAASPSRAPLSRPLGVLKTSAESGSGSTARARFPS